MTSVRSADAGKLLDQCPSVLTLLVDISVILAGAHSLCQRLVLARVPEHDCLVADVRVILAVVHSTCDVRILLVRALLLILTFRSQWRSRGLQLSRTSLYFGFEAKEAFSDTREACSLFLPNMSSSVISVYVTRTFQFSLRSNLSMSNTKLITKSLSSAASSSISVLSVTQISQTSSKCLDDKRKTSPSSSVMVRRNHPQLSTCCADMQTQDGLRTIAESLTTPRKDELEHSGHTQDHSCPQPPPHSQCTHRHQICQSIHRLVITH